MWHVTCDMWHVTCDMWHVTCETWREMNILSKFQVPRSYGLGVRVSWWFGGKGWVNESINEWRRCLLNIPGYTGSVNNLGLVQWWRTFKACYFKSVDISLSGISIIMELFCSQPWPLWGPQRSLWVHKTSDATPPVRKLSIFSRQTDKQYNASFTLSSVTILNIGKAQSSGSFRFLSGESLGC